MEKLNIQIKTLIDICFKKNNYQILFLLNWFICNIFNVTFDMFTIIGNKKYSIVHYFNIKYQSFEYYLLKQSPTIGNIIGGIFFILTSNRFTYKDILFFNSIIFIITIFASAMINHYVWISFFLAIANIQSNCLRLISYIQGVEIASKKNRALFNLIIYAGHPFSMFFFQYFLIEICNFGWKGMFAICIMIMGILELIFYFLTVESPRNLIKMKKYDEAYDAIRHISFVNGLLCDVDAQLKKKEFNGFKNNLEKFGNVKQVYSSSKVFNEIKQSKKYHKTIILFCLLWFLNELNQYHISDQDNSFYLIWSGEEIGSIILIYFMINIKFLGRRRSLYILYFLYGFICLLFVICIKRSWFINYLILIFKASRLFALGWKSILFLFSFENYPTSFRSTAFGLNVTCSGLGVFCELVVTYFFQSESSKEGVNDSVGQVVVWLLACIMCGVITYFLPEKMDEDLQDVDDAPMMIKMEQLVPSEKESDNIYSYINKK